MDLEPTTLANYRYLIEAHILPVLGDRPLAVLTAAEISTWERGIAESGYSLRTARDARSALVTVLGGAIPQHLQSNPAQRRRGKGRKGRRRIELYERAEKAWPTPLQALLVAERCAALSGCDTDFVMIVTIAYAGMRWSEAIGLRSAFVRADQLSIEWKLYEQSRFYFGRPKDGSIRPADLPPFLAELLADHVAAHGMGHGMPGMRGVYGHVTPAMRDALTAMLQERWEASLREWARLSPRSIVPVLDALLTAQREAPAKIGSHSAPKIGHQRATRLAQRRKSGH